MTGSDYGDYSSWYYYEILEVDITEIIERGQKNKEDKISAEAKKEADAKAARQAKFDEAKSTGKRVLLSQYFLSGNDIPRRYRDEDSDMGHLCTWANPDGTTCESFSHAY
jgi:seryl-tRNA synthetase